MFNDIANINLNKLKENSYPGRGIIIGLTPDGKNYAEVYWIMGRSENSRNRVFAEDNGFVRTKAYDESKIIDPSLIIYYPIRHYNNIHIVSNGDQTDTVYNYLKSNNSFEEALNTRYFEPDEPNFTPRITGIVNINGNYAYKLSILKSENGNPKYCTRIYYEYDKAIEGYGHCIHTYAADGNPLPSFNNEPYIMPLYNDINKTSDIYWGALNSENKISLLVKYIDKNTGNFQIKIINKHNYVD